MPLDLTNVDRVTKAFMEEYLKQCMDEAVKHLGHSAKTCDVCLERLCRINTEADHADWTGEDE